MAAPISLDTVSLGDRRVSEVACLWCGAKVLLDLPTSTVLRVCELLSEDHECAEALL